MAMSKVSSMENTCRYITICIDNYEGRVLQGRAYHECNHGVIAFRSLIHMVLILEGICSELNYPMKSMSQRQFETTDQFDYSDNMMHEMEIYPLHEADELKGKLATIQLHIRYRYNATWQGDLTWLEDGEHDQFESFLQLLEILDNKLGEPTVPDMGVNSNRVFRVAVDECKDYILEGRLYHPPLPRQYEFHNVMEFMRLVRHSIEESSNITDPMSDHSVVILKQAMEVYRSKGNRATFIVRILFAENATWQGTVILKETGDTVSFRSFLELVMLMERTSARWNMDCSSFGNEIEKISS